MAKQNTNAIHLWHDYHRPYMWKKDHISIGIALCGTQHVERMLLTIDPEATTCKACEQRFKDGPKKPECEPATVPAPTITKPPVRANKHYKGNQAGVIVALSKRNPRKPGTGKYERMALLLKHDGQTVETFAKAGGNLETLNNAIKEKIIEVRAG